MILFGGGGVSVPACTIGHMTGGCLCLEEGQSLSNRKSLSGGSLSSRGSLFKMGSLSKGFSIQGGSVRGGPLPPYGNKQAVRILLECILVIRCQL